MAPSARSGTTRRRAGRSRRVSARSLRRTTGGRRRCPTAIRRLDQLLDEEDSGLAGAAYVEAFLGGLVAQQGDFDEARALVASARETLMDLGLQAAQVQTYCSHILGEIELLAGDASGRRGVFRELCVLLERSKDFSHLASRASDLAEALAAQGRYEEADHWTRVAERHAGARRPRRADQVATDPREDPCSKRRVRDRVAELAEGCTPRRVDGRRSTVCAKAHRDLGEVLRLAGRPKRGGCCVRASDRAVRGEGKRRGSRAGSSWHDEPALV